MKCPACDNERPDATGPCPSCGAPLPTLGGPPTAVSSRQLRPVSNREERAVTPVHVGDVFIGRYRLTGTLGEGGMGTVYIAHDVELERDVAVKVLASNLVTDDEVVERFEREARLNARLDHPNIAPVYDVGRHQGRPFIVMKVLEGDTLTALLRARGPLPMAETLALFRQLAAGLDYIHARGFIHRDIKTSNIFVGPDGHATILDFGILRAKGGGGLTRTGLVLGTPQYMAPEQALGQKDVDHRVDLYALAVVLFECVAGSLPFQADSEIRLIQLQAHAPPPNLAERAPWVPAAVARVLNRALAKRPDERFSSGAELLEALEAAFREAAEGAPPPKLSEGTAPGWRMKAGLLDAARKAAAEHDGEPAPAPPVALPPVTLVPADSGAAGTVAMRPAPPPSAIEARSRRPRGALFAGLALIVVVALGAWLWPREPRVATGVVGVVDGGAGEATARVVVRSPADAGVMALAQPVDAGASAREEDGGQAPDRRVVARRPGRVNLVTTRDGEPWWAAVFIDEEPRGRTPLLLDLPPGRYALRVERAGFRTVRREIKVASGQATVLRIDLVP